MRRGDFGAVAVTEQDRQAVGGHHRTDGAWRTTIRSICAFRWIGSAVQRQNIGAIANGKVPGRESDDQIILYSVGGMPVEDVAWGKTVYETALEKGIGTKLNLWDAPYLY